MKLTALVIMAILLLIVPGSALWQIQDRDYYGYVVFADHATGYAHIQYGPFSINQSFTYEQTGPDLYVARSQWLTSKYEIPFRHQGNIVISPMFPDSFLIWVPE